MSRIAEVFSRVQNENRAAFMPYLMAGDPEMETTRRLLLAMGEAGADLIELGIPFSDPMADGPTNQRAAERALAAGASLAGTLEAVRAVRKESAVPILLMGYLNPFLRYGLDALCRDMADAGADGLIIPDLQPDDADELLPHADAHGISPVFLIAPTSTPERLRRVGEVSRGFVYAVSLTGVTGARDRLPPTLHAFIDRAREAIGLPIAVGFGIGTPTMAREVAAFADGVIVGSAVVKRIEQAAAEGADPVPPVRDLVRAMADAVKR